MMKLRLRVDNITSLGLGTSANITRHEENKENEEGLNGINIILRMICNFIFKSPGEAEISLSHFDLFISNSDNIYLDILI